jgi:hypothetical protein
MVSQLDNPTYFPALPLERLENPHDAFGLIADIYEEATDIGGSEWRPGKFSGALYQRIASTLTAEKLSGSKLHSPDDFSWSDDTLQFFCDLYPDVPIFHNTFGLSSLQGVHVPDALLWRNHRVQTIYEMSLGMEGHSDKILWQIYRIAELKKQFKEFSQAKLIYVIPRKSNVPSDISSALRVINKGTGSNGDIGGTERMPFSSGEFGKFVDSLYHDYRLGPDEPTLAERHVPLDILSQFMNR